MRQRNLYDLTHFSYSVGEIGRLQCLSIIPVLPGDSFEFNCDGIYRLADLRRELVQDAQVDIFYFYRPHRHEYGDDWVQMIKEGVDEDVTFTGATLPGTDRWDYLCQTNATATSIPTWMPGGYNAIWNRYFKHPDGADRTTYAQNAEERQYGYLIGRLPHPKWNPRVDYSSNAVSTELDMEASDYEFVDGGAVSGTTLTLNLRGLDQAKGRFRSEVQSNIMSNRYNEILKEHFNVEVDENIDERPTLFWRHSFYTSGTEINATDTTSLGSFVGKSYGSASHQVPRRFFDEHGAIFVCATIRFPTIHELERHFMYEVSDPRYLDMPDPNVMATAEPRNATSEYFTSDNSFSSSNFSYPDYDCFRYHPNRVHEKYQTIAGYPFSAESITGSNSIIYHQDGEYDDVFATQEMAQWQINMRLGVNALRYVPDPLSNWFQGSD